MTAPTYLNPTGFDIKQIIEVVAADTHWANASRNDTRLIDTPLSCGHSRDYHAGSMAYSVPERDAYVACHHGCHEEASVTFHPELIKALLDLYGWAWEIDPTGTFVIQGEAGTCTRAAVEASPTYDGPRR